MSMSLLSVPALVKMNISVLFMHGKAVLFDRGNDMAILGRVEQETDGLFHITDVQKRSKST